MPPFSLPDGILPDTQQNRLNCTHLAQSIFIYGFCRRKWSAAVRGRWLGSPKTPQFIGSVPHLLSHYKFTNSLTRKWTTLFMWYTNFSHRELTRKLNPGFPWQKQQWTKSRHFFTSEFDLKFTKQVKCYIWSVALICAETWILQEVRRSRTPCNFHSVVLEGDGEDQLDLSCEKWRSAVDNQWGKTHLTYTKAKEG